MKPAAYYEDFTVGQVFHAGPVRITRERIISFAEEFDPQPQHLSEDAASRSQFGALVASGWHTAAVSMRLFVQALPPIAGGGQGAGLEALSWPTPVFPDDALRIMLEVTWKRESRSRPERGLVKIHTLTLNQRDETVQAVTHTVMMPRSGKAAS